MMSPNVIHCGWQGWKHKLTNPDDIHQETILYTPSKEGLGELH